MPTKDPRVDAYLKGKPPFARDIQTHLRALIHEADPDIVETIKWGGPSFEHDGMVVHLSSHKKHVRFSFWKGAEIDDPTGEFEVVGASGQSAATWESLDDLPRDAKLKRMIKQAVKRNVAAAKGGAKPRADGKAPAKRLDPRRPHPVPGDLAAALRKDAKARKVFEAFAWSDRRDYVQWLEEAKREATRAKRLAATIELLREGKTRHWKYRK
ncbi:MAG: YdeI/OmpD-associated family protein [Planctomycetota bacterium]|jgi:hypothetical protein